MDNTILLYLLSLSGQVGGVNTNQRRLVRMRKVLAVVLLLLMVPFASAGILADEVHLSRIRLGDYGYVSGNDMDSYVYVYNDNSDSKLRDGSVSVRIMDSGVYDTSGKFDVGRNTGAGRSMVTPVDELAPGEYLVKVTYSNGDIHKTKYRYVYID